ncbi:MAG: rubrerythrin [uncultured bacterium]|nr:MAG: rubrerythrin [uncultured bacterium]
MKTFICEICGDAYLGEEKPKNCPFCGARAAFVKDGKDANPVVEVREALSEQTVKNLQETLQLEIDANAIYLCMAGKADSYEVMKMYKRLAKVELEHATICTKLLQIPMPEIGSKICSDEKIENFNETIKLEENASGLYAKFAKEATEKHIKILFTALNQAEIDHIELIKNYLVINQGLPISDLQTISD